MESLYILNQYNLSEDISIMKAEYVSLCNHLSYKCIVLMFLSKS